MRKSQQELKLIVKYFEERVDKKQMEGAEQQAQKKNKNSELKTFPVPFALGDIKRNISATNKTKKSNKEYIINQAFKFHSQGNIQEAAKYYQYFIDQGLNDHRVFSNYGLILKSLGKLKEAELSIRKAIEIKPDFADAHSNLGNLLRDVGNLEEAELSIRKAIEIKPDFADAHSNLGGILTDLGNLQEAEISTRKAIQLNPDFADAHFNLGNILRGLNNLQQAEISTRKAIQLNPDLVEAHSNLGGILTDLGNLQEAEISTRKAIQLNPDFADAHFNLGIILETIGKIEEAIFHSKKSVELKPEDEKLLISLTHILCSQKNYELALKYLSNKKSDACHSLYLGCLLSLDREEEFDKKYKELSKNNICNADIGGIAEHANIIYEKRYTSTFCNEAIKYVLIDKINEGSLSEKHLNELIEFSKVTQYKERSQGLLTNGAQSSGNLFLLDYPFIKAIKMALEDKIKKYKTKFKDSEQGFINNWPEKYELSAWLINMKTGGFLAPHNHEYGWITGSFYLQVPKLSKNEDAGSIAFSYQGPRYPHKEKDFKLTIQKIENRDICIFPSSLFHHTIPFKSSEERICFVFDLVQK